MSTDNALPSPEDQTPEEHFLLPSVAAIEKLYGPAAAAEWAEASDGRRRGMLRTLERDRKLPVDETPLPPIQVSMSADMKDLIAKADEGAREQRRKQAMIEHARKLAQDLARKFVAMPVAFPELEKTQARYAKELLLKEALLATYVQGDSVPDDLMEDIAQRALQLHILDILIKGEQELTYGAIEVTLDNDPRCATFHGGLKQSEYLRYIMVLKTRKQITEIPDA